MGSITGWASGIFKVSAIGRVTTVAALVLGAALLAPSPVDAQSDGNGLEESSVNTFLVNAEGGVVRVTVDITLRNVTSDRRDGNTIIQTFFNGYGIVVPAGAENIEASRNGNVLDGELLVEEEGEAFSYYQFDLGRRLFNGQSTSISVTYDHAGSDPRSELPWRANAAYASFVAFGLGDTGNVTINIVLPVGYEFDEFTDLTGFDESEPDGFGSLTYTRSGLDEEFGTLVSLSNDALLTSTQLDVPGADLELRSWPDDPEWAAFAKDKVESGIPELEELIGAEWPLEGSFDIRQTVEPNFFGYAGWFDSEASEIAVGEELDALLMYHELSHAWFNSDTFNSRWLSEGFAELYSAEMSRRDGDEPPAPETPPSAGSGRQPLANWTNFSADDDTEQYGYNASYFVMQGVADDIGFDRLRDVLSAARGREIAYQADGAEPDVRSMTGLSWRRMLDYFELTAGSTEADALFREYVVPEIQHGQLDDRAESIVDYVALSAELDGWSMPLGIRERMDLWAFDTADDLRADAREVLALRTDLTERASMTGIDPAPDTLDALAADFATVDNDFAEILDGLGDQISSADDLAERQTDIEALAEAAGAVPPQLSDIADIVGFDDAIAVADDHADALQAVIDAASTVAAPRSFTQKVGLYGADPDAPLSAARAAIESGDTDAARAAAADAVTIVDDAGDVGTTRLRNAIIAAVGLLALVIVAIVLLRRRRRRRAGSSGSGVAIELGDGDVDLDEDALAGAGLGGMDDVGDVPIAHPGEAAGTTGVVERRTVLGDVGDPVLELDEDIGTMVDADAVPGTEVLIDPHSHDEPER